MGNRAVIAFKNERKFGESKNVDQSPAIYLHWNGSPYHVHGFLKAAKEFGIRGDDPGYCMARLTQVIGNTIGGTLSMGIGCYGNFGDPGDNGVYWIKNWEVVERETWTGGSENSEGLIEREQKPFDATSYAIGIEEVYLETLEANAEHFKQGAEVQ